MNNQVTVHNMTRLFDREMLIYSFFDIRLKKPARVIFLLYFLILLIAWSLPLFLILPLNPYTLALMLSVPIGGATLMSKPIWGGKKFFDWLTCQIKFFGQPSVFYDCCEGEKLVDRKIDFQVQVSRRDDYKLLKELRQRRIDNANKQA